MPPEKKTKSVKWPCTNQEQIAYGRELADMLKKVADLEFSLKATQTRIKGEMAEMERLIKDRSEIVASGLHWKEREIVEYVDAVDRIVSVCDKMTGEEISTRPATDKELVDATQIKIFDVDDGLPDKTKNKEPYQYPKVA